MKNKLKSFLVPMIIGGLWGVVIYLVSSLIFSTFPIASSLFFPVLFGGIAGIFSICVRTGISVERAIIVGLLAGSIYNLLSPIFPLFASILVGACIGAGLGRGSGKIFKLLDTLVRAMKGVLLFPILIFFGNLVSQFGFSIFNSSTVVWFIWGFLLFFAIYVTCAPFLDSCRSEGDRDTYIMLDEIKRESQGILEEMRRL
jgi:hypothetical protein